MTRTWSRLALCLMVLLVASCGKNPDTQTPTPITPVDEFKPGEKPKPPLELSAPAAPVAQFGKDDLQKVDARILPGRALAAAQKGDYAAAVQLQHYAVARTGSGMYNLACFYALNNQADAALYWLQEAGLKEGVDVNQALGDDDFQALRKDPRWMRVVGFLNACNNYWAKNGASKTVLVLPKGYQKEKELTVIVWLHGMGSRPDGFVNEDTCQELADVMNVAFVGVSGTQPTGPNGFVWAEDPARDAKRIEDALKEVSNRLTVKPGFVITMGFSQGAATGLEVAVRDPEKFAGSIVMSSGSQKPLHLEEVVPSPLLAKRGFVLTCGAQEHPGNVKQTKDETNWLLVKAKAKAKQILYPNVKEHVLPKDFFEQLPQWVKFIESARK